MSVERFQSQQISHMLPSFHPKYFIVATNGTWFVWLCAETVDKLRRLSSVEKHIPMGCQDLLFHSAWERSVSMFERQPCEGCRPWRFLVDLKWVNRHNFTNLSDRLLNLFHTLSWGKMNSKNYELSKGTSIAIPYQIVCLVVPHDNPNINCSQDSNSLSKIYYLINCQKFIK